MSVKYVITKVKGRLVSATYISNPQGAFKCESLRIFDPSKLVGNIYIGRVEHVVKNLNCAFIEIQKGVKCYYSLDDNKKHIFLNPKKDQVVHEGDLILVQVTREAIKTKPATVTSKISLAGNYVVLSNDVKGVTISGKTSGNEQCKQLKKQLEDNCSFSVENLQIGAQPYGLILRTNSAEADQKRVTTEANELISQYQEILRKAQFGMAFDRLYQSAPGYIEELKHLRLSEISEMITDDPEVFENIHLFFEGIRSDALRLYQDTLLPLYKLYSVETELEHAISRKIWLKSGAYLIIEQMEALTVVDVNTGKFTTKKSGQDEKEASFLKVNKEAADEIARQLKLRNLSGIMVIDFINMKTIQSKEQLMAHLRSLAKQDPVKTSVIDMTKLGLVEMTRMKSGKSLMEAWEATNETTNL